ncbi:MAG: hypothetical protein GY856_49070 [bacterium]|nr:hypothetical protein [bacterium]
MSETTDALATAVEELTAEMPHDPAACPDAGQLAAYHRGKLSAAAAERIQDHLQVCPESRGLLLDLERLANGELGAGRSVSELEMTAVWKGLRSRIAAHDDARVLPFSRRRCGPRAAPALAWLQVAAASFALATLGLSGWVFTLNQRIAVMAHPHLHSVVRDLTPATARGEEDVTVITLAPDDRLLILLLNLNPRADKPEECVVELLRSDGEPVLSEQGRCRYELNTLPLTLARELLTAGEYRIRIHRTGEPRGQPVAEFALRIEDAAATR